MTVTVIVAGIIGALFGLGLALLSGRRKLIGLLFGAAIATLIAALLLPRLAGPPRCQFPDPGDLPTLTHPAGYVYVIQDVEFSQRYKIGRTTNPERRLSEIRNLLPGDTDIVAIIDTGDAPTLEWQLHQRYADERRRGEWFALDNGQVRDICRL